MDDDVWSAEGMAERGRAAQENEKKHKQTKSNGQAEDDGLSGKGWTTLCGRQKTLLVDSEHETGRLEEK